MRKKKFLSLSGIVLGVLMCLSFNKVQAVNSVFSDTELTRDNLRSVKQSNELSNVSIVPTTITISESNYKTNNGEKYWILKNDRGLDIYCTNLKRGFGSPDGNITDTNRTKEYTKAFGINDANFSTYTGLNINDSTKNKITWILKNTAHSENDLKTLLEKASEKVARNNNRFEFVIKDMKANDNEYTKITLDDAKLIQQIAIWHYTNPGNIFENINAICDKDGNQFSSEQYGGEKIHYETDTQIGDVQSGIVVIDKLNAIYQYFIDNAELNANYTTTEPTLSISNTEAQINMKSDSYYIAGPFKLTATNKEKIDPTGIIIPGESDEGISIVDKDGKAITYWLDNKYIEDGIYLKIPKNVVTAQNNKISFKLGYKYKNNTLTFLTDSTDYENTQPVANIKNEEINKEIETEINLTSIDVKKIWNDENNQDGKRPASVEVGLYKNETLYDVQTLNEGNAWKYTWVGLLAGENYQIRELDPTKNIINNNGKYNDDYTTTYVTDETGIPGAGESYTITNTHIPSKINKTVKKIWDDANNQDGKRPESIEVILKKNGTECDRKTLNAENPEKPWEYTWTDLPEYENGNQITYSVEEVIPNGYTVEYTENGFTITNKYVPGVTSRTVKKVWDDANNQDGKRPDSIEVILKKNGTECDRKILNAENPEKPWEYTWQNLPERENGNIINYEIIETPIESYTATYNTQENITTITNKHIPAQLDFSLRKFITSVNDKELKNEDGTYTREPVVDTSKLGTIENDNKITTAIYKHTKEPIAVEKGDIVTYTIRVYNEGEADGYVSQITDHLPAWLDFLPDDELNKKYLWVQDQENNRTITTDIAAFGKVTGEEVYSSRATKQLLSGYKEGKLDYIDVQIKCKVNDKAQEEKYITNIADITGMQSKNGTDLDKDVDSTKANVNIPTDELLPEYKGHNDNKIALNDKNYYYKGQEDDDDFEKIIIKKFDLSLRKFIIAVNDTELKSDEPTGYRYTREPKVDTTNLENRTATTATYMHTKEPVEVKKGDKVTYIIRVYNEGNMDGYATEILEDVPEGLTFIEDSSTNKEYGWKQVDGKLVTNYLADKKIEAIQLLAEPKAIIDYKDIKVEFKVTADAKDFKGSLITNWAEIKEDSNNDIDSTPGNGHEGEAGKEDDVDYEPLKLNYFDLSLRKFITNVNGTEYNNRVPQVDTSKIGTFDEDGKKITTATYTHTKDPVVVAENSIVTYTIRIYNEGTVDGYANEVTDNIPEGLEFLPEDETNKTYKWLMIDEEGNITQDASRAKKITTNYLSENNDATKIINGYKEENGNKTLSYQDVKVAFKVVESKTSNRIVVNTAEISKASDEDIDSTPNNNDLKEDDIDNEYLRLETFDLALKKWVTATKVTYKGKTKTTKTGFTPDSTEIAKVDLVASRLKNTTVKFVYNIRVTNEGQVAGYATEIIDYVPSGLEFKKEDNKDWVYDEKDGTVTTTQLKDKLIQPGQSETIEIVLTWKNSTNNMGLKTNWAEISADSGDDIDSTPNNNNKIEDDIDDAKVILSIKTGEKTMYIALIMTSIAIIGGGAFAIKKYVINK